MNQDIENLEKSPSSLEVFKENNCNKQKQEKQPRKPFCGRYSVVGFVNRSKRHSRLTCKSWTCGYCGPRKVKRFRKSLGAIAEEKKLTRFLTLTLDPKEYRGMPEDSLEYIRNVWRKFRTSLKRKFGNSISFVAVVEPQKSGYAHLHILIDRYIAQIWLSEAWQAVGGGKIVFIKQVDVHRIVSYLSKYFTKEFQMGFKPVFYYDEKNKCFKKKKPRRFTTSRNILIFKQEKNGNWEFIKKPISDLFKKAKKSGIIINEIRNRQGDLLSFDLEGIN